ncbi:MAG: prepilin-type N-terminal cleavage/methylation domain-containing protein [Verrucomicrobia bacterium]|nr:prepilin-type N-terminal cleavage/methylation domain-containing protein [Verrucomicrobiota bacterium]
MLPFRKIERRAQRAFSMVEISLALAIIGISMVSILGLMGVALDTARNANDENQISTIVNQIVADRRSSQFNTNSALFGATNLIVNVGYSETLPLYFRKNGQPNGLFPYTNAAGAYYRVRVAVTNADFTGAAKLDLRVEYPANAARINVSHFTTIIARGRP